MACRLKGRLRMSPKQDVLTTLSELTADHFETAARWLSKPAINRWLTPEWRSKETTASMMAIAARNRRNRLFLVSHQGRPCGLAALGKIDSTDRTAMLWYGLGEEELSGRGITSSAV